MPICHCKNIINETGPEIKQVDVEITQTETKGESNNFPNLNKEKLKNYQKMKTTDVLFHEKLIFLR